MTKSKKVKQEETFEHMSRNRNVPKEFTKPIIDIDEPIVNEEEEKEDSSSEKQDE